MFFVYPSLIFDFLNNGLGFFRSYSGPNPCDLTPVYMRDNKSSIMPSSFFVTIGLFTGMDAQYIRIISIILLVLASIFLAVKKDMVLEQKIAYFFIFSLFFDVYLAVRNFIFMVPIMILLFTDQIDATKEFENCEDIYHFFKNNAYFIIGLICLFLLIFLPSYDYFYKRLFNVIKHFPVVIVILMWIYIYVVLVIAFILLRRKFLREVKT